MRTDHNLLYSSNYITKYEPKKELGNRKLKFDWLDFFNKEPNFEVFMILNSFQNMIKP